MTDKVSSLTRGGVRRIMEMENPADNDEEIILQVTQIKLFEEKKKKNSIKQRLVLSDGVSSIIVMVDTKRYSKMQETGNIPSLYDIVSITKCSKSEINERQLLVLSDVCKTIYRGLKDKIGSPKDYTVNLKKNKFTEDTTDIAIPEYAVIESLAEKEKRSGNNEEDAQTEEGNDGGYNPSKHASKSIEDKQEFTPIKALNSFVPDWKLKAKVARKGEKKSWSNARGTGYLMSVDLIDSNGDQIQGTFFKEAVDKFDQLIEEGGVYMFSNGCVKMANKKFTAIKNDYSITFGTDAEVERVDDDGSINGPGFDFQTIKHVPEFENGRVIDIIGVVFDITEVETIRLRAGGEKNKRMVSIADNSEEPNGCSIKVCFWGEHAQNIEFKVGDIVAFRSLRISDFNGKSLNTSQETTLLINPNIKEAKKLTRWFKGLESIDVLKSFTVDRNDMEKRSNESVRLIKEMCSSLQTDSSYQNGFFVLNCYVMYIKADDKSTYLGCPDCHKKIFIDKENYPRCDGCSKVIENPEQIYMLTAKVGDLTDSIYINFYRNNADPIMGGMTAEEYNRLRYEENMTVEKFKEKIDSNLYKQHSILVKAKQEQHMGEDVRLKFIGTKILDYSFKKENWNLLDRLDVYSTKPEISNAFMY